MNQDHKDKICNNSQIASIETSILDQGPGKSLRIAWINTGSGLRYKLVLDRAMDIVDAFYNQHSLTWLSEAGITKPGTSAENGNGWLTRWAGGLITTCGLTHVGAAEKDENSERGLHGKISNIPAQIESIIQPDIIAGKNQMSVTAIIKQADALGTNLQLRRTISSTVGKPSIKIKDVVTNKSASPTPHMILYHCNFGWPLVAPGADIIFNGNYQPMKGDIHKEIFNNKNNFRKCAKPRNENEKGFQGCAMIDLKTDSKGCCLAGICNKKLGIGIALKYKKRQLPVLTNWQLWKKGDYITALEPGTNGPIGQTAAKQQKELIYLLPGKSKTYEIELTVLTDKKQIDSFIKSAS